MECPPDDVACEVRRIADLLSETGGFDVGGFVERILLPVLAIAISAGLALLLATRQREDAQRIREQERHDAQIDRLKERRLEAAGEVIAVLAHMVTLDIDDELVKPFFRDLRARVSVYQSWFGKDDSSGDWLTLRYREIVALWTVASQQIHAARNPLTTEELFSIYDPPRRATADTIALFTRWLTEEVTMDALLKDGARILKDYPRPEDRTAEETVK